MDNNLFKILKELHEIRPEADYYQRSKAILLSEIEADKRQIGAEKVSPKFKFAEIFRGFYSNKLVLGAVSAVVLLLIISGGVYYVKNQLNQNDLVVKASETNASIQVKLNEIQYLLQNKASSIDANQILTIKAMLQNATDDLKAALSSKPEEIGKSLDKLKAAQDMLYQTDQLYGSINQ